MNRIDQVFMEITKFRDNIEIVIFLQQSIITHDGIWSYTVTYYLIVPKYLAQVLYIISGFQSDFPLFINVFFPFHDTSTYGSDEVKKKHIKAQKTMFILHS